MNTITNMPYGTIKQRAFDTSHYSDLCVWEVGMEKCAPGHAFGPAVRRYYLLHIVLEGKGVFEANKTTYALSKGDAFLIFPDEPTYYQANVVTPWTYIWIAFSGNQAIPYTKAAGLRHAHPIYTPLSLQVLAPHFLIKILNQPLDDITVVGLAHQFFGQWIQESSHKTTTPTTNTTYVQRALIHIASSYWQPLKVQTLARLCGLDRSHFCRILKRK